MVNNLPESEVPDVREYIYADVDRVRSLLAQMSDGLPGGKETTTSRSSRLRLGLKISSYESGADASQKETTSLADLHVSQLEEAATALGMLPDISEFISRKRWLRGKVRDKIEPGMLLRVTAPTLLVDPSSVMATMSGLEGALDDADDDNTMAQMASLIDLLYGQSIALSIRPTEEEDVDSAFVGSIPRSHAFVPMTNDLLLSRVGPVAVPMTSLVQVARIPSQHDSPVTLQMAMGSIEKRIEEMTSEDNLNRGLLDSIMSKMGELLEQTGLAAAPKWPAISVVPLAIYRNVLPAIDFDEDDDNDQH